MTQGGPAQAEPFEADADGSRVDAVDAILRESLSDPDVALVSGHWSEGVVMEILPRGRAQLSRARYGGEFAGVRDLHVQGEPHHLHLDVAQLACATYVVAPSVCFGFRPSFELRLARGHDEAPGRCGLGLSIDMPYRGARLRDVAVERYFRRLIDHQRRFPQVVAFVASAGCATLPTHAAFDWDGLAGLLLGLTGRELAAPTFTALAQLVASLRTPGGERRMPEEGR